MILNIEEWIFMYKILFDGEDGIFRSVKLDSSEVLTESIPSQNSPKLAKIHEFYQKVIKRRHFRSIPLSVEITFTVVEHIIDLNSLYTCVVQVEKIEVLRRSLIFEKCLKIYRLLGQIVDQSQATKHPLSFSQSLKKLGFGNYEFISQMRHSLTHQDTPNLKFLEISIFEIFKDIYNLYWTPKFEWMKLLNYASVAEESKKDKRDKSKIDKQIINEEYTDLILTQNKLKTMIELFESNKKKFPKREDVDRFSLAFLKTHLKKSHRKIFACNYLINRINESISDELMEDCSFVNTQDGALGDIPPGVKHSTWVMCVLLMQILDIFSKNSNIFDKMCKKSKIMKRVNQLICYCNLNQKYKFLLEYFEKFFEKILERNKYGSRESMETISKMKVFLGDKFKDLFSKFEGDVNTELDKGDEALSMLKKRVQGPTGVITVARKRKKLKIQVGKKLSKYLKEGQQSVYFKALMT